MIEENPILKHDSEGFSVVCDLKLLLELLFKVLSATITNLAQW